MRDEWCTYFPLEQFDTGESQICIIRKTIAKDSWKLCNSIEAFLKEVGLTHLPQPTRRDDIFANLTPPQQQRVEFLFKERERFKTTQRVDHADLFVPSQLRDAIGPTTLIPPPQSSPESKESRVRRHVEAEATRLKVTYRYLVDVIIEDLVYSPVGDGPREKLQEEIRLLFDKNQAAWHEGGEENNGAW